MTLARLEPGKGVVRHHAPVERFPVVDPGECCKYGHRVIPRFKPPTYAVSVEMTYTGMHKRSAFVCRVWARGALCDVRSARRTFCAKGRYAAERQVPRFDNGLEQNECVGRPCETAFDPTGLTNKKYIAPMTLRDAEIEVKTIIKITPAPVRT